QVTRASAGYAPNANSALTVEHSGNVYMNVLSGSGESGVLFGSSANAANGGVLYNSGFTPNGMQLRAGGNIARMSISSSGDLTVADNTSWSGYKFGVIANQPTAMAALQNLDPTGYSGFHFYSNTNVARAHMGVGNASSPNWVNMGYAGTYTPHPFVLTTNDLERLRIDAAGNVGIGTTTPSVKLDVVDGNWLIPMRVKNTLNNGYSMTQYLSSTNQIGHIGWGNPGAATHAGEFYLGTTSSVPVGFTTGDVERMRIDVAGNVGIGTTTPAFTVDIASTGQAVERLTSSSAPTGSVVELKNVTAGTNTLGAINFNDAANTYPGQLAYHPTGGLTLRSGGTTRIAVMPSGRVGVGTLAPNADLEVNGYTMLGSTAPAVKMLKITSTTAATQGSGIAIPHGVSGIKILAVNVSVEYAANNFVPDGFTQSAGYQFTYNFNNTNVVIFNSPANSANILSKPIKILITYEQ
ncbi:MAG TPA: hypothetical protein PK760_01550, partial [Flavobacteriales bacterium]|nr:hypothetical protein [Flavobacteriales bacterium]